MLSKISAEFENLESAEITARKIRENVDGIKKINAEEKDGRCSMIVLAADDIREGIFGRLSQHGLPILSCSVAGSDLENAFLNMTEGKAPAKGRTEGKK